MKILAGSKIKSAICACKPSKIAAAYIGKDWEDFVPDADALEAVIVSPTIGSNPWAISALGKKIGWDKVFFLDELHAKVYIGNTSAVVGSANLTRNGLSGEGLVELCSNVTADEDLKQVNLFFDEQKIKAQEKYPDQKTKLARLIELEKIWGAAISNKVIMSDKKATAFMDFELLGKDHFYVIWYLDTTDVKSESEVVKTLEEKDLIDDFICFAEEDDVSSNKWVLTWPIVPCKTTTYPFKSHGNTKPSWVYIHDVFKNGMEDKNYPTLAIQRADKEITPPPFKLTTEVIKAFRQAVQEEDIARYLVQIKNSDKDVIKLADSLEGIPLLINKMKEYLKS